MAGVETPVEQPLRATADASGTATVSTGGVPPWKVWRITRTSVTTTSVARTTATLYRNSISAANVIDSAAISGNNDTSDTVYEIRSGEQLIVVWTGADVGASCTATISGVQTDAV